MRRPFHPIARTLTLVGATALAVACAPSEPEPPTPAPSADEARGDAVEEIAEDVSASVVPVETEVGTEETEEAASAFAGAELVARTHGTLSGLALLSADGTVLERLPDATSAAAPRWSPDGTMLAFRVGGDLRILKADGSELTVPGGEWPTWSPEGDRLAFQKDGDIHVVDLGTAETRCLGPTVDWEAYPAWLPDGRIAFATRRYEGDMRERYLKRASIPDAPCEGGRTGVGLDAPVTLSVMSAAGDDVTALPGGGDFVLHLAASPVEGELVYMARRSAIAVLDVAAEQSTIVVEPRDDGLPQYPRFGPEGRRIVFMAGNPSQLWVVDRATGDVEQLTDAEDRLSEVDWRAP